MPRCLPTLAVLASGLAGMTPADAQVAFVPNVASFPNGVTLGVTPVVSADRRYVRMTVNPQFNALEGFDAVSVPAAVSGGGAGGFRNVPAPGPTVSAGMDGSEGPQSYGVGPPYDENPAATALLSGSAGFHPPHRFRGAASRPPTPDPAKRPPRGRGKAKRTRGVPNPKQADGRVTAP